MPDEDRTDEQDERTEDVTDSEDEETEDDAAESDDGEEDDDKPLGPKGEKALAAMKAKLKAERTKRRAAEAKLAGQDKTADGGKTDTDQARKDAEDAATARANQRILRSEIKAAAAGKLADPMDALRFLDLDKFEVDADGEVDEDEIAEAIDELLTKKPYLAAAAQGGKKFQGGGDGGARKPAAKKITEEQLKKMTKPEIAAAYAKGELAHLL